MLHYTWGTVIKDSFGRKLWEFDKRTYTAEEIQRKARALLSCCACAAAGCFTMQSTQRWWSARLLPGSPSRAFLASHPGDSL